jgi:hypothetical protein
MTESEMYCNVEGSVYWNEFLDFLGSRIRLKGWDKYDGGLDTKSMSVARSDRWCAATQLSVVLIVRCLLILLDDMTGVESIFTEWHDSEIMWHVSTMLPYLPADPKQLARKKHIGNDRCVIIFRDGESAPLHPAIIASKQLRMSRLLVVMMPDLLG